MPPPKHHGPGFLPGLCFQLESERVPYLRPALCCVFPATRARWLRILIDGGRLRDAQGLCRLGTCQCRFWTLSPRLLAIFGGKQRSYHAQRLHFLFESREFELFLPQNFIDILHILGTLRPVLCEPDRTVGTPSGFVKHLRSDNVASLVKKSRVRQDSSCASSIGTQDPPSGAVRPRQFRSRLASGQPP